MSDAYSISELTTYIREMFEVNENLQDVWVQGEVSNMRRASSGHWYFTLKDSGSQLKCVMWRTNTARQSVLPDDGDAILAHGYVGVYDLNIMHQYGDISRSKAGQKYLDDALGTDPADRAARSSTPHVDRIKAPVFLVHGMQDDRAHFRHYEEMQQALKAKNHRFETLLVPRAGHGARDLASVREVSCRMIDFLDRHIGDRKSTDAAADCQFPGSKKLPYEYFKGGA